MNIFILEIFGDHMLVGLPMPVFEGIGAKFT